MKVKNIMFSGFAAAIFAGVCGAAEAAVTYELTSKSYVDTELAKKQDNLSAGTGIDITNNVVKTTLDLTSFATKTEMSDLDTALKAAIAEAHEKGDYATATDLEALQEEVEALQGSSATAANLNALQERVKAVEDDYAKGTELTAAQSELQTAISNLKSALEAADAEIAADVAANTQAIANEASARAAADTAIETAYKAADSTLDGKISAEASARESADTQIRADFATADVKVLEDANKYTDDEIAELNQSLSGTTTNLGALTERVTTAEDEIDALQTADTTIRGEFAAADKALEEAYKAADTAIAADVAKNAQAIADETSARVAADTAIESAYKAADSALDGKISAEVSARESADTALDGKITAMDAAYKAADAKVLEDANKYTDDEIAELNQSLTGTATNLGELTTRVSTAEGEIDALQAADTAIRSEFAAADTELDGKITAEASAREQADEAIESAYKAADTAVLNAIDAENFVSANGILTTKGGYLVLSDGQGNVSLSQVAVVNGDGSKDMITGDSLN